MTDSLHQQGTNEKTHDQLNIDRNIFDTPYPFMINKNLSKLQGMEGKLSLI